MPFTIDEERMKSTQPFKRKGQEIKPLFEMNLMGPPVIEIPHADFPRVVYMHPNEPFRTVEHRNANMELVLSEQVPTTHLTRIVQDEKELEAALADGWVKEAYMPKAPPDPDAHLYGKHKTEPEKSPEKGKKQ
jgi:hypothetical protein